MKGISIDMLQVMIATILFGIFTSVSIVLTGDRAFLSNANIEKNLVKIFFDWRFITSMALAISARFTFIYINSSILKIPTLAQNSTTITSFITAFAYIFIMIVNYFFLKETLTLQQFLGAGLIMAGIFLIIK